MKKQVFEKVYTRDTTLIIQQAWCVTLDIHRDNLGLAEEWKDRIQSLHYLNDGVVEIWENTEWTPNLMDKILEKNLESEKFFDDYTKEHEKNVSFLEKYWEKGFTDNVEELKKIVNLVFETMYYFDWMYYSSLDDRTPQNLKSRAVKLREVDVYFDKTDGFIRKSLISVYPSIAGYEQGVLRNEISQPPSLEILKERKNHFVVIGERSNFLGTLEEYSKVHSDLVFKELETPLNVLEINGQIGSVGKVRGRVRIMKRKEQVIEAESGDVLVSTMTTPDFVPAMQKAVAIVTDEGGIMCHAAIIAREMKKPCIVGTKIATKIFKDGDMVEVDADRGIVRKID